MTASLPVFLSMIVLMMAPSAIHAEGVEWRKDYARALKEATEKGLPLLVNIGSENCFWCKQLDGRTFIDEEVIRTLNGRFIPLKVDGNKNPTLTQALKVQTYPTLIFASADGNILGYREGFMEASAFKEQMGKVLLAVGTPDWMQRDFETAGRAIAKNDSARAISLLKGIVEDGKSRAVQVKARQQLAALEKQATEHAAKAKDLASRGKTEEALAALESLGKNFPGTLAARDGAQLRLDLVSRGKAEQQRQRQARDMLALAQEDYKGHRFLCCLDRCETLSRDFGDLDEGRQADKLATQIKDNTEWARKAADQMTDRLCLLYMAQAESWLKKGQPDQAILFLDRVLKLDPTSNHAEVARGRLARLRGTPEVIRDRK